jgi:hypothetical protein
MARILSDYEVAKQNLSRMAQPKRGQVYQHYKGGLYSVVSVSIKEDDLTPMVTYSSNMHQTEIDTTRTMEDFMKPVMWPNGFVAPRFQRETR